MKIEKKLSLNESAEQFIEEAAKTLNEKDDDDEKITFIISYDDKDDNPRLFKAFSSALPLKKNVAALLAPGSLLDKRGATALYVDSSEDIPMFTAYKNDDGSWDIAEDKIDEVIQQSLPSEYRDVLLNRVYYSLTGLLPENLKIKSPSLYSKIIKAKKGAYVSDGTEAGYTFENGDGIITMAIKRTDKATEQKVVDWVKEVADHFGCELKDLGYQQFRIIVPGQEKLFER